MSDQPGNNAAHENNRNANMASVAHHSGVVVYFSSAFVTLVGFFSTGAFTVGLTILATDSGRKLIAGTTHLWIAIYFWSAP
ncbi:hypothetical protein SAMN05892877_113211 [Rhizobium subbaraonis]|uniref:Uncharacterized protein n=1 Tax=Rhizobium subbaraonis TaxID=908946 RepID=A0A285UUK4_9HYPH|nr:hypothetical protein [Rhizobium subbaraonis]SOC45048.1 hypothetical protein SAMN05892877_113211 [Rhizobium subbaraonis]